MGEKLGFKKEFGVDDTLLFGVSLSCTSFGDVVQSFFLGVYHLCQFKTRSKSFLHLSIIRTIETDPTKNMLIAKTVQSTEEHNKRDVLFNHVDRDRNTLVLFALRNRQVSSCFVNL